jgi:hypothetical protein
LRVQAAEAKLAERHTWAFGQVVRCFVEACGLGWSEAHERLVGGVLRSFAEARIENGRLRAEFPEPETQAARRALDGVLGRDRAALGDNELPSAEEIERAVEAEAQQIADAALLVEPVRMENTAPVSAAGRGAETDHAASASQDNPAEPEHSDALSFDQLPEEWQRKYRLHPSLGVREYLAAVKREQREEQERQAMPTRRERHPSFSHPGYARPGDGTRSL